MKLKEQKYAQHASFCSRGWPTYEAAAVQARSDVYTHLPVDKYRVRIRARSSGKFDVLVMARLPESHP